MPSFSADPQAMRTASTSFSAQVDPINTQATKAEQIQGSSSTSGRYYPAQGTAYHAAVLSMVQTMFTPMAARTVWVADTLSGTATAYAKSDHRADSGLTAAGEGS